MTWIRGFDGLRAIAVAGVVACHISPGWGLGGVSYGVYLFHMPVLELTEHYLGDSEVLGYVVAVPVTLLVAALSFHLVERPIAAVGRAALGRRQGMTAPVASTQAVPLDQMGRLLT